MQTQTKIRGIIGYILRTAIASVALLITLVAALITLPIYLVEYVTRVHNKFKTEKL